MRISFAHSDVLDHFLALHRELRGRFAWENSLVQRPVTPVIAGMADGLRSWREGGLRSLPHWTVELDPGQGNDQVREGTRLIRDALAAAEPELTVGLLPWAGRTTDAEQELRRLLPFDVLAPRFADALGVPFDVELTVHPVPYAPNPPALGFLSNGDTPVAMYVDCRRFTGSTLADCVLTMAGWAALRTAPAGSGLPADLAGLLPGGGPYHRRLRALLIKILLEITAGELVRSVAPDHRSCVDVLGTAWRYPRLFAVADRYWGEHLAGLTDRAAALSAMTAEIAGHSPRWYVDHVDASALAADFYLMESLAAADDDARHRLARWLPLLAGDFAQQLDLIVGTELGHYERAQWQDAELAGFLSDVTAGDSRVAWPRVRGATGETRALALAHQAFAGPGAEFGGEAWAPVAAMMHRYARGELPLQVFVDQCFTLQHNNGSLFDKFFDTTTMRSVLDAQAAGDMELLAGHASAEVRARWHEHQIRVRADYHTSWLGTGAVSAAPIPTQVPVTTVWEATPGALGCGTAEEPVDLRNGWTADQDREIRVRQPIHRRPLPATLTEYDSVTASLHTTLGVVRLRLLPAAAPYTVDNFVQLAAGTRRWVDPVSGADGEGGFYDGTTFHRRVPGFLVQGGDRTGTGHGGPGYRLGEEIGPELPFDRPFLVGMANSGNDSSGSQFFVTLAAAPHLTGRFTCFGSVLDPASQQVLTSIAAAAEPVVLIAVETDVHSKSS